MANLMARGASKHIVSSRGWFAANIVVDLTVYVNEIT
jgi:hypothetical protein